MTTKTENKQHLPDKCKGMLQSQQDQKSRRTKRAKYKVNRISDKKISQEKMDITHRKTE